jgi:hypothetical protein
MSSATEDIVTEIITTLTTPAMSSVPAASVFRDIMDARRSAQMPCVCVEAGDEDAPVRALIGRKDRRLDVHITVLAKGSNPYGQADAAVIETHARLFASPVVGGEILNGLALDIVEGPTRRSRDGMDEDIAAITKTYTIEYRTAEDSLVSL